MSLLSSSNASTASVRQMVLIAATSTVASSISATNCVVSLLLLGLPYPGLSLIAAALFGYVAILHFRRVIAKAEQQA